MNRRSDYSTYLVSPIGSHLGTIDCSFRLNGGQGWLANVISGLIPQAVASVLADLVRDIPRRCVGARAEGAPYDKPVKYELGGSSGVIEYMCWVEVSMRPGIKALSLEDLEVIVEWAVREMLVRFSRSATQLSPHLLQLTRN